MKEEFLYCGELVSIGGLEPVEKALARCSWRIVLRRSGYDGTLYLSSGGPHQDIDLEMQSGQSGCYLFEGGVDGTQESMLRLLGDFSRCLTAGGFTHRVEIYDSGKGMVGYFHFRWPEGHAEPAA